VVNHPNRNRHIWTFATRLTLFQQLVKRFGPYSEWERATLPGHGMNVDYDAFCADFARAVGARSADAVKHQIAFAMPIPEGSVHFQSPAQAMTTMLCMAAAYEAAFITHANFPELLLGRHVRQAATIVEQPEEDQ
jgi:hypothetical protein